jgi:hypothetical protein
MVTKTAPWHSVEWHSVEWHSVEWHSGLGYAPEQ